MESDSNLDRGGRGHPGIPLPLQHKFLYEEWLVLNGGWGVKECDDTCM